MPNALPVTETPEMLTLAPPELLRVSVRLLVLPIWTLPKLRFAGLADKVPGDTPVPDRPTLTVAFDALLVTAMFPVIVPVELGANLTLKLVLCPLVSVMGKLMPLTLYPLPLGVT